MNFIQLYKNDRSLKGEIHLTSSKSESNRALIIQAISGILFSIRNLSPSEDTQTLKKILTQSCMGENTFDAGHAGTTFRFLTAYFASREGTVILTGSDRMKQRPVGLLVNALKELGADIKYIEKEGYPPLKIKGKTLKGGTIVMDGSISSQYISALSLIVPELANDLVIEFKGEVISKPYIAMTLKMMEYFGVESEWKENSLYIKKQNYSTEKGKDYLIESDWSAASYWYSMAALSHEVDIKIYGLKENSLQGDSVTAKLYASFGVKSDFFEGGVRLTKTKNVVSHLEFDFTDCPDIAQTIAVTAAGLNIPIVMNGLKSLRIKETDRIQALINELQKVNCKAEEIAEGVLKIIPSKLPNSIPTINTYDDHRMAMSFAPLALMQKVKIAEPSVVKKSYPGFWDDLKKIGFILEE